MFLPSAIPPFGVTHPIGLPRPIDVDNFFGAQADYFARNVMPIPTGCLDHFDEVVYRPYVGTIVAFLNGPAIGWSGPAVIYDPPRYCLLCDGLAAHVPLELRPFLPPPPRVPLGSVLKYFGRSRRHVATIQLLDVLSIVSEDLGPARFAAATADHPWVADFMR